MSGVVGAGASGGGTLFRGSISSATLPTISTDSVPAGKTWVAHGVCTSAEAIVYSSAVASETGSDGTGGGTDGGADSGTEGAADSGTSS